MGLMAKHIGELEKSAQFLSSVVEEAAAKREQLSRDVERVSRESTHAQLASTNDAKRDSSAGSARNDPHRTDEGGVTLQVVQQLKSEERQKAEVCNNVLLTPVCEIDCEDVQAVVLDLEVVPELKNHKFTAERIGQEKPSAGGRPRLVRIRTTGAGQKLLMSKRDMMFEGGQIYVNHDLTRAEREERKRLLPRFCSLRTANIQCSFPRDQIIHDGIIIDEK